MGPSGLKKQVEPDRGLIAVNDVPVKWQSVQSLAVYQEKLKYVLRP
jgi:hypothetical protein